MYPDSVFPYSCRYRPLLELFTRRGRLVRCARAFARAHALIETTPERVDYSDAERCWFIAFPLDLNPPGTYGIVHVDPTPYFRVRLDALDGSMREESPGYDHAK
jgi:hypothetical protein